MLFAVSLDVLSICPRQTICRGQASYICQLGWNKTHSFDSCYSEPNKVEQRYNERVGSTTILTFG